jgi:hypothetical protein
MAKGMISSANRRNDIVSSAIEVFAEIGYYRATTAQVAERATITQPYVYRFFTKEHCSSHHWRYHGSASCRHFNVSSTLQHPRS